MANLGTVNPNRTGIIHRDCESGEVCGIISDGLAVREGGVRSKHSILEMSYLQSRFEAAGHRLARIAEGGLSSGMVFLMEFESDGVPRLSNNGGGVVREKTRTADDNTVVRTSGSG